MLGEGEELVNDGGNVTLVVLEQVAVEVEVEETHAVEGLELGGELLSGLDARGGGSGGSGDGLRDGGGGNDGGGDGNLLGGGDNVDPDAGTKGRARGTLHAPVGDVASELLGGLHLDGDGHGGLRRDLAGNIDILDGAQAVASVGLKNETAAKGPGGGTRVGQTPDLGEALADGELSSIGDGNVAQKGHLEEVRGDELSRRDNGAAVGGGLDDLRLHGLDGKERRGDDGNGLLGDLSGENTKGRGRNGSHDRRGNGRRSNGCGRGLLRLVGGERRGNGGSASTGSSGLLSSRVVPSVVMRTAVPATTARGAVGASGVHGEGVVLFLMNATELARVAQMEIGASIALMDGAGNGRHVAAIADVGGASTRQEGASRLGIRARLRASRGRSGLLLLLAAREQGNQRSKRVGSSVTTSEGVQERRQVNVQDIVVGRSRRGRGSRHGSHERRSSTLGDEVETQHLLGVGDKEASAGDSRNSVIELRIGSHCTLHERNRVKEFISKH